MKFVDKAKIKTKAGNGGPGAISFRREKYVPQGGPSGGDGGNGGNILFQASKKKQTLLDLKIKKTYKAENGKPGSNKNRSGQNGKDFILVVPCGTLIYDQENNLKADLTEDGSLFHAAKGGKGGFGNARFATPTNRVPRYAQPGLPGEEKDYRLELRLIAEIGLIGLPNAGKSTLLKTLTRANPKIADYPFTTLFPNLGVLNLIDREIVIADIPGIIEGASKGLGLGSDFLRHIDRTKLLIHLIDSADISPKTCWQNYTVIREELHQSNLPLEKKNSIVVLSKIDMTNKHDLSKIVSYFKSKGIMALTISCFSKQENLNKLIWQIKDVCDEKNNN
ncbi:GTPase ObgE [Candidatus Margulisiibacteriota bacterium]